MRSPDQHLSADEIERLEGEGQSETDLQLELEQAREHAEMCKDCRQRINVYRTSGTKMEELRNPGGAQKGPDCPPLDTWLNVAGESLPTAEQDRYVAHAAGCDHCGPVLREIVQDFNTPPTQEEEEILAATQPAVEQWRKSFLDELRSRQVSKAPSPMPYRISSIKYTSLWRYAGVAAVLLIGAVIVYRHIPTNDAHHVNALLTQAYGERRTIEPRISGAAFGTLQGERGPGASQSNRPTALVDAEAIIAHKNPSDRRNADWLHAQGRVALLEGDFPGALSLFQEALKTKPEDQNILIDEGVAYFEVATVQAPPSNYKDALGALNRVLQKDSDNKTALFNRALIYEKQSLWEPAKADWEHYLRLDPKSGWANEASEGLRRCRDNLERQKNGASEKPVSPDSFLEDLKTTEIAGRIEAYQDAALRKWLPAAFPKTDISLSSDPISREALTALANILSVRFHDQWLSDLLKQSGSPAFSEGIAHLRDAISNSRSGDVNGSAYTDAENAEHSFIEAGNKAGAVRSEVEEVHALRRAQQGDDCLEKSRTAEIRMKNVAYRWARIQLEIDQCSCFLMTGRFDLARSRVLAAATEAQKTGYRELELRAVGLSASVDTDEGDLNAAWHKNQMGLASYWQQPGVNPMRAQQFYDDLSYAAENIESFDLALLFAQESAEMAHKGEDPIVEPLARQHLAKIALRAGQLSLASRELKTAGGLLDSLPFTPKTRSYRFYSDIGMAGIDLQRGQLQQADERLKAIQHDVDSLTTFTILRGFYSTYAEVLAKENRLDEAEVILERGLNLADHDLQQLSAPSARYLWSQENASIYRSMIGLELAKRNAGKAFALWEWYRSAPLRGGLLPTESFATFWEKDGLRNEISSSGGPLTISYALLPIGVFAWTIENSQLQFHAIPSDSRTLAELTSKFVELCSTSSSDMTVVEDYAQRLYALMIKPLRRFIKPGQPVIVELDDEIADLPVGALIGPDGKYLSEMCKIVLSPGILYQRSLRPSAALSRGAKALVVGSTANLPGNNGPDGSAADIQLEARHVASLFINVQPLQEANATTAAIEANLPAAEIFHFAGHALSGSTKEGLLLFNSAERGKGVAVWGAKDAKKELFQKTKLAVLSACSTGKGYRGRREIHGELIRGILMAGVPSILAARWDVGSHPTRQFMEAFYAALLSGNSVSTAAQAAENSLRNQAETRHPYYWAPFGVFGRG